MDKQRLKQAGLKVTLPRIKILDILQKAAEASQHLTAEVIHHRLEHAGNDVGLATVYRVLTQFEAAGLIERHHFESGQAVFEMVADEHHDHLVCIGCGAIEEFVDNVIEERQAKIAEQYGFIMQDHALNIYGSCPKCQQSS